MSRNRERDLYFERLGSDFERFMSDYDVERRIDLIFERLLPKGVEFEKGLEVGCGTGRISRILQQRVDELTVTDISAELATKVGSVLGCAAGAEDAMNLSFPDESFDLIVSSECIEHVRDPWRALDEMARVLAPGGVLAVTTPNRLWYPLLVAARATGLRKFAGRENWLWPHDVRRWIRDQGLGLLLFGGCHLLPWQIPGIKRVLPRFERHDDRLHPMMINFGFSVKKPLAQTT